MVNNYMVSEESCLGINCIQEQFIRIVVLLGIIAQSNPLNSLPLQLQLLEANGFTSYIVDRNFEFFLRVLEVLDNIICPDQHFERFQQLFQLAVDKILNRMDCYSNEQQIQLIGCLGKISPRMYSMNFFVKVVNFLDKNIRAVSYDQHLHLFNMFYQNQQLFSLIIKKIFNDMIYYSEEQKEQKEQEEQEEQLIECLSKMSPQLCNIIAKDVILNMISTYEVFGYSNINFIRIIINNWWLQEKQLQTNLPDIADPNYPDNYHFYTNYLDLFVNSQNPEDPKNPKNPKNRGEHFLVFYVSNILSSHNDAEQIDHIITCLRHQYICKYDFTLITKKFIGVMEELCINGKLSYLNYSKLLRYYTREHFRELV